MKRFLLFLIRFYRRELNRAVRRLEGRADGGLAAASLQPIQQGWL